MVHHRAQDAARDRSAGRRAVCPTTGRPAGRHLHVVILSSWMRFPHGRAATSRVRLMARALGEAGTVVRVLVMQASERPPVVENTEVRGTWHGIDFEYCAGTTIRHRSFAMRRLVELRGWSRGAFRLIQLRSRGQLDVVYLWPTAQPDSLRRLFTGLLRLLGVPVVVELNEQPGSLQDVGWHLSRRGSPLAGYAGAVSISRFLSEWTIRETARRRRPCALIEVPILVDIDEIRPGSSSAGDPVVLFAGAPDYDETIRFILEALQIVWRSQPRTRLVVTGANPAEPAARWLRDVVDDGGLDERVEIAGYLSRGDLLERYATADALLIPLFNDTRSQARFPTKLGEYLASGRPVVSSRVGEVGRFLEDGVTAYLAAPDEVAAFAGRICAVLDDPVSAAIVGAAGRRRARECFDYANYGESLRHWFAAVAAGRRPVDLNEQGDGLGRSVP